MKIILLVAAIGLTVWSLAAGENGEPAGVGEFYGVIVHASANVIITQGEKNTVRTEGGEVKFRMEEGALIIEGENHYPVDVYITAREINLLEAGEGARIFVEGSLRSDILLLKAYGNGSVKVHVKALSVGLIARDNGKISVSGTAGDSFVRMSDHSVVEISSLDVFGLSLHSRATPLNNNS
jgi:hypothetical protein